MEHQLLCFSLLIPLAGFAQQYSIEWYEVACSGGASTGGIYFARGTVGRPDAGGPVTGGNYSLTGGFWSLFGVVQTAGVANLAIAHSANSVTVYWPNAGAYTLLQHPSLTD